MYNQKPASPQFDQADLQSFRTYSLVFLLSTFGAIVGNLIYPELGAIVRIIGYLLLTYGIYMFSKKYTDLASGMKVVYLFALVILLDLASVVVTLLYPEPSYSLTDTASVQSALKAYLPFLMIGLAFSIVVSFVLLFATYYFTHWFNEGMTPFNQTQAFWYFGLFNFIGVIVAGFGSWSLLSYIANNSFSVSSGNIPSSVVTASLITLVGAVIALAAGITLIVASFKIYYRLNDMVTGKAYFKGGPPNQGYGQQPPNQPYSQPNFNQQPPSQPPSQTPGQTETKFCRNCGTPLDPNVQFCQNCGTKV